jgi:catechol 2,3-dioxygenase-like lactoylglutathione lyase family enzyme
MSIRQIKETCLYVTDLDRTTQFYHEGLGLPVIGRVEGRHVFFRAGTSVLLCFIADKTKEDQDLPPHYGSGHLHMAFEVTPADYETWKEKVRQAGIPSSTKQPGGAATGHSTSTTPTVTCWKSCPRACGAGSLPVFHDPVGQRGQQAVDEPEQFYPPDVHLKLIPGESPHKLIGRVARD